MKCPHCSVDFHDHWSTTPIAYFARLTRWEYRTAVCPRCKELIIELRSPETEDNFAEWRQVHPIGSNRGPVPPEVPSQIATDYVEACLVLPISPKASAALARRCLQAMLHAHGYKDWDLAREVQQLLDARVLPNHIHEIVDVIRGFGNFSAHPINDQTSLQVIDVDPHEAEWCLEILEALFDHFYVGPEKAKAKKAALDQKLKAAKPPSK
jgi:Domain of unknown function (DUF4145)